MQDVLSDVERYRAAAPVPTYKEMYYRLQKSIVLANVLRSMDACSWTIRECADPEGVWINAARLAGCAADYVPSQETREVTLRLMMNREEIETRIKEICQPTS